MGDPVTNLYIRANKQLKQSWFYDPIEQIKAVFIRAFELHTTRRQMQMPLFYRGNKRSALHEFSLEQFKAIWPEAKIPFPTDRMEEKSFMDGLRDLFLNQRIERVNNRRYFATYPMMLAAATFFNT